ncbi:MAG: CARDB domain-containing protein [Lyngbya sp.]|nr:CARDB domain-containing protein [Lyngbya sp.]
MAVDLSVSFGQILETPTIFPTEDGRVEVIITNNGDSRFQGRVGLNLYASTDAELDSINEAEASLPAVLEGEDERLNDNPLTRRVNLAPGASRTITLDFSTSQLRTASVVAPGAYFLLAEIDPGDRVSESDETNNIASQFISTDGTDVVADWNSVFLNAVQESGADAYGYGSDNQDGTIPPVVPRNGAVLHTAIYDTVINFEGGFEPFAVDATPPEGASVEAAVVGAAFTVLNTLYPDQQADFAAQRDRSLAEINDSPEAEQAGFDFGVGVANQLIDLRDSDFATPPSPVFQPSDDPGTWRPIIDGQPQTPVGPQFESVPPFFIPSTQQFRTDGPPQFGSPLFALETEEVRELGALKDTDVTNVTRTDDETEIAQFWSYDRTDTFRPAGQWNQIGQSLVLLSQESGEDLTVAETSRLFALLNIAMTDAGVVSWDSKFDFLQLRPEQTINADPENEIVGMPGGVDFDGNPISIEDPDWDPLIGTPAFPDYTSGHAAFGAAAAEVFKSFFGTDNFSFELPSQELPGVARSYGSFSQAAEENAESRIFGGIHIRSSADEGLASGAAVGLFVAENALLPTNTEVFLA